MRFRWGLFYKSKHLFSPTEKSDEEDIKGDNRCFSSSLQNAEAIEIEMQCLTSATGNAQGSWVSTAESVNNVYPR